MSPLLKRMVSSPLFVLFLIVFFFTLTVALAGFSPSQFGHTGVNEIEFETEIKTAQCDSKFCSATCDPGYYAVGGGCGLAAPRFAQLNLMGASRDQRSWNCFDSNYVPGSIPAMSPIIAKAICLRTGDYNPPAYEFCGNYTIETVAAPPSNIAEICDMNNTTPYDCTSFATSGGEQLCESFLSCTSNCQAFDVSNCEYCNSGACPSPQILCADHTCQLDCSNNGGGLPSGMVVGSGTCNPPISPPSTCPDVPPPTPPGIAFCGNNILEIGEECDGDGAVCPPSGSDFCPIGNQTIVVGSCSSSCLCEYSTICIPPPANACDPYEACTSQVACDDNCPVGESSDCGWTGSPPEQCCGPCIPDEK